MKHVTIFIKKGSASPYIVAYKDEGFAYLGKHPLCTFDVEIIDGITLGNYAVEYFIHRDDNGFVDAIEIYPPIDGDGIADNLTLTIRA